MIRSVSLSVLRGAGLVLLVVALVLPVLVQLRWQKSQTVGALRPAMLKLPPGRFRMGDNALADAREHDVQITVPFALSVTEVTQEQYRLVMGENPSHFHGEPNLPVERVSFDDALRYCNRLSKLEGLEECYTEEGEWPKGLLCKGYRLPTEAEWEYAARAASPFRYAGSDDPKAVAWYDDNSDGKTHPVAQKTANTWGLYDLSGNVWEWVFDEFSKDLGQGVAINPVIQNTKNSWRVVRGGSWDDDVRWLTVSNRGRSGRSDRIGSLGFRLSRSLP